MKTLTRLVALVLVAGSSILLVAPASAGNSTNGTATYTVTFVPTWNPATHPLEYPITHARGGFLTPMIGATHGPDYRIFQPGEKPTPGLEMLSEMGKHSPLDDEINRAIADGRAGSLIELSEGSDGPVHTAVTHSFSVDEDHPMVSLVGMIAPSPDWFYGVSAVRLSKGGRWLPQVTVDAFAWDSGGDSGTTYMAADADLMPKELTRSARTAHFTSNGKQVPVGQFVFKLVPSVEN